jgi:small subunit ribosomal protein S16
LPVKIRLQRHGRKKRPFYRVVAADSRSQRDGRFIEGLGYYNPLTEPAEIIINQEKALKWLKQGAQPTDTAKNLLSKIGVWQQFMNEKKGVEVEMPEADESESSPETEVATPDDESAAPEAEKTETAEPEDTESETPSEEETESP